LSESEESALIQLCQAGDKKAFSSLVERHRSALFGTAYLMTQDKGTAEDAVQRAMIKVWKHIPSLRLRSSFKSWLMRILVNEVNQMHRKKHLPAISLEDAPEAAGDPDEAEIIAIRSEQRRSLRQAMEMLTDEQREAVILRYYSELSFPEIAIVTGTREGTIKSRLSRALDRLGEILRNRETGKQGGKKHGGK
jgi:RNA polymerase sigma-70 factor (ECF subfamily)